MIHRCYSQTDPAYRHYGGRGILVCEYLRASLVNLLATLGIRPGDKELDRIDNNGHYSCGQCAECLNRGWPMNIRWANRTVQMRNTRLNRMVTIGGVTKCYSEWAADLGMSKSTFYYRYIKQRGCTRRRIFS